MRGFVVFLWAIAASAQSSPALLDLSGPWRFQAGDDALYADPAFDDGEWETVQLPGANFLRLRRENLFASRYFWLRKTVTVPESLLGQPLSLTLGKLTENLEVFLNGARVGRVGAFNIKDSQIARPRVIDLQALPSARVTVAIRAWVHPGFGASSTWRVAADPGPYHIGPAAFAPREAGSVFVNNLRLMRTLDLVVGVALVALSLIPFLMYLGQRQRPELFWLALHAVLVGCRRLHVVLPLSAEAKPWAIDFSLTPLHMACLLEFVMAAIGRRNLWIRAALWITVAAAYMGIREAFQVIEGLSVLVLLWAMRQPHPRRWEKFLIIGGAALVFLAGARNDSPRAWMEMLPPMFLQVGPYGISAHSPLTALLTLTMILLLTRRLLQEAADRQRMQGEIEAARLVQQIMVTTIDRVAGFSIDSAYVPAQETGGDFYQVIPLRDGAALVVVGDVSGKGLRAAMVVSLITGAVGNHRAMTPAALLAELNHVLCSRFAQGFVTAICLRLELDGRVLAASAGHLAPYGDGRELELDGGLPLGVSPDAEYVDVPLQAASSYALISDGVVEAANVQGELFGFERTGLISGKPAQEIAQAAQSWGQNDDITVVTVSRRQE